MIRIDKRGDKNSEVRYTTEIQVHSESTRKLYSVRPPEKSQMAWTKCNDSNVLELRISNGAECSNNTNLAARIELQSRHDNNFNKLRVRYEHNASKLQYDMTELSVNYNVI